MSVQPPPHPLTSGRRVWVSYFTILCACAFLNACAAQPDAASYMASNQALSGTPLTVGNSSTLSYNGANVSIAHAKEIPTDLAVPDGSGGLIIIPGEKPTPPNPAYTDARELKLKVREMAEQLIADVQEAYLQQAVALPVAFVNLNNFEQSSAFGRLLAEQLIYEFNQRGFPVREYHASSAIHVSKERGELYLSRAASKIALEKGYPAVVAGTYHADSQAIFVNARVIRPADGRVLRTASMVLPNNALTKRMLGSGNALALKKGTMQIQSSAPAKPQSRTALTPFDLGEDVH